jgi:anti-sigma factor RsiW
MSKPDSPTLQPTACAHRDCNACARAFFRWRKMREAQMALVEPGAGITFTQAALTSVRP